MLSQLSEMEFKRPMEPGNPTPPHTCTSHSALLLVASAADGRFVMRRKTTSCGTFYVEKSYAFCLTFWLFFCHSKNRPVSSSEPYPASERSADRRGIIEWRHPVRNYWFILLFKKTRPDRQCTNHQLFRPLVKPNIVVRFNDLNHLQFDFWSKCSTARSLFLIIQILPLTDLTTSGRFSS